MSRRKYRKTRIILISVRVVMRSLLLITLISYFILILHHCTDKTVSGNTHDNTTLSQAIPSETVAALVAEEEPHKTTKNMFTINNAHVMSLPCEDSDILLELKSSTVVSVTYSEGGNWCSLSYEGIMGYINMYELQDYDPNNYLDINLDYRYQDLTREVIDLTGNDMDEYFFYGMMYVESRFRVVSESYAGAQGIMQIMPTTWETYYVMFCEEYPEFASTIIDNVMDIRSNITIGIYITSKTARSCKTTVSENPHRILTSYNLGIGGANKYYNTKGTYVSNYSSDILRAKEYIRKNRIWKEGLK